MNLRAAISGRLPARLPVPPVRAADARWSVISSVADLRPAPTPELLDLMLRSATRAASLDLESVAARAATDEERGWIRCWPGEHYRFLAALVDVLQPQTIVEVGTWQGTGALALADRLPESGRVITYDILPWDQIPGTVLRADDLAAGRISQRLADLADPATFRAELDTLRTADLIFSDAPKDGVFEPAFLDLLVPALADRQRLLVLDDIRLMPMVQLWRDLPLPKVDATSLGHWSGTGLAFLGSRSDQ